MSFSGNWAMTKSYDFVYGWFLNHYPKQCCQVHGFPAYFGYFYTVAVGCSFSSFRLGTPWKEVLTPQKPIG